MSFSITFDIVNLKLVNHIQIEFETALGKQM